MRYVVEMLLLVEAENKKEADRIADKIVNYELPEEIEKHIVKWSYTKPVTEEEYEHGCSLDD